MATYRRQPNTACLNVGRDHVPHEVLEALFDQVGMNCIICLQSFGAGKYEVTFRSAPLFAKAVEAGLKYKSVLFELVPAERVFKFVYVRGIACETPDEEVKRVFSKYGEVESVSRELWPGYPTVETGGRRVKMVMKEQVPNFVRVEGRRCMCHYPGMVRVCSRCGSQKHLVAECPQQKCVNCAQLGHIAPSCKRPCRRCNEQHPLTQCPIKTFASVVGEAVIENEAPSTVQVTTAPREASVVEVSSPSVRVATAGEVAETRVRDVDQVAASPEGAQGGMAVSAVDPEAAGTYAGADISAVLAALEKYIPDPPKSTIGVSDEEFPSIEEAMDLTRDSSKRPSEPLPRRAVPKKKGKRGNSSPSPPSVG